MLQKEVFGIHQTSDVKWRKSYHLCFDNQTEIKGQHCCIMALKNAPFVDCYQSYLSPIKNRNRLRCTTILGELC